MRRPIDKNIILKTALVEFSKHGYQKASTNIIAKKSGVSKGTIFNYFKSKANLFSEVMEYSITLFKEQVETFEISSEEPVEIFFEAILFLKKFYEKNRSIYNFYLKAVFSENTPCRKRLREVVKIFSFSISLKIIDKLNHKNLLAKEISEETLLFYINAFISRLIEVQFFEVQSPFESEKKIKDLIKLVLNGILKEKNY